MSDRPQDWEQVILRGKTALAGAMRRLTTDVISWLEEWQKPKRSSYRHNLLTEEEYEAMRERQGGVCAICGEKSKNGRLAVDHVHGPNTVRGLLCSLCNTGLGLFKDDPDRLAAAIEYLKSGGKSAGGSGQAKNDDESLGLRGAKD